MKLINLEKNINLRIKAWINEALQVLKEDIDDKTPTKSKELIEGNEIENAKQNGSIISWKVINEVPHWKYVEYWVRWWNYNYHKWPPTNDSTIFYTWVWARMFSRGFEEKRNEIKSIINKYTKWT